MHTCLYCGSPCEVTLATSSEGCTNKTCRAYLGIKNFNDQIQREAAEMMESPASKTEVARQIAKSAGVPLAELTPFTCTANMNEPCMVCEACTRRQQHRAQAKQIRFTDTQFFPTDERTAYGRTRRLGQLSGVTTGRFQSSKPNNSNIPPADIELEFTDGYDMHTENAMKMFGVERDAVTPAQRRAAKSWALAANYGASPEKLRLLEGEIFSTDEEANTAIRRLRAAGAIYADGSTSKEHSAPLLLHEVLTHRDPERMGLQARVMRLPHGEIGSKNRRQYELAIIGMTHDCSGVRTYGTQGQLLEEWKRDFGSGDLARDQKVSAFEANMRWWPNTMRVVVDPAKYASKEGADLLGVLSLVSVHHKGGGLTALYDYVTVVSPKTGRARLTIHRGHIEERMLGRSRKRFGSENFAVALTYADEETIAEISKVHLPAVAQEMELHLQKGRTPRNPTMAETCLLDAMRKKSIW